MLVPIGQFHVTPTDVHYIIPVCTRQSPAVHSGQSLTTSVSARAPTRASGMGTCTELVWRSVDTKHTQASIDVAPLGHFTSPSCFMPPIHVCMLHASAEQLLHLKLLLTPPLTQNLCHGVNSTHNIIQLQQDPRCAQVSFGDLRRVIVVCVFVCFCECFCGDLANSRPLHSTHPFLRFDHRVFQSTPE